MNWNWKTIILLIILGIATSYATLYYLQWRDKDLWKRKEQEQIQQEELTEEEQKIQEISRTLDQQLYQIQDTESKEITITEKTLEESAKSMDQAINQAEQPIDTTPPKPKTTEERSQSLDSLIFK